MILFFWKVCLVCVSYLQFLHQMIHLNYFYPDCPRWSQDAEYIVEPGDKIIICCVRVIKFLLFIGKKYSENFTLILRTFALFTRKVTRLLFNVFISQTARVKPQNANFSGYYIFTTSNIQGNFQIYIGALLRLTFFHLFFLIGTKLTPSKSTMAYLQSQPCHVFRGIILI